MPDKEFFVIPKPRVIGVPEDFNGYIPQVDFDTLVAYSKLAQSQESSRKDVKLLDLSLSEEEVASSPVNAVLSAPLSVLASTVEYLPKAKSDGLLKEWAVCSRGLMKICETLLMMQEGKIKWENFKWLSPGNREISWRTEARTPTSDYAMSYTPRRRAWAIRWRDAQGLQKPVPEKRVSGQTCQIRLDVISGSPSLLSMDFEAVINDYVYSGEQQIWKLLSRGAVDNNYFRKLFGSSKYHLHIVEGEFNSIVKIQRSIIDLLGAGNIYIPPGQVSQRLSEQAQTELLSIWNQTPPKYPRTN